MLLAIKEVTKPVSASALTTIAGLLALLFMSFTIGFDIGIVLMKSIVISAICALTLLPAMLLLLDKLMQMTPKKPLVVKGKIFAEASFKAGKFIVPVAVVAIAVCCVLSSQNSYNFVDSCNKNENISKEFGESGTLILLYEKLENSDDKEKELIKFLEEYRTADDEEVLKSAVAYSSTISQMFDVERASRDLGISKKDAELLFTIYYFEKNDTKIKLTNREFIDFVLQLIDSKDEDAAKYLTPEIEEALNPAQLTRLRRSLLPLIEKTSHIAFDHKGLYLGGRNIPKSENKMRKLPDIERISLCATLRKTTLRADVEQIATLYFFPYFAVFCHFITNFRANIAIFRKKTLWITSNSTFRPPRRWPRFLRPSWPNTPLRVSSRRAPS